MLIQKFGGGTSIWVGACIRQNTVYAACHSTRKPFLEDDHIMEGRTLSLTYCTMCTKEINNTDSWKCHLFKNDVN